MFSLNTVFLIISSLLVFHTAGGAEILDQAPVLKDGQPSYYFIRFEEGTEVSNNVALAVLGSKAEQDSRLLKITCRERSGITSIDLITNPDTEEDQILLDTVFVNSCGYDDVYGSIFPQPPSSGKEIFVFLDTDGKCHRRTYTPDTWQFTATVYRSAVESIECPETIKQMAQGGKGVVKDWSPNGLALQTFYVDKPSGDEPSVTTESFPGVPGYKLVCRSYHMKFSDPMYEEEGELQLTATVEYDGNPLDRFKLKHDTCNVDNIVPKTISSDNVTKRTKHTITFTSKTSGGSQNREYELSFETPKGYEKVSLSRRLSKDKIN